MPNITVDMTNVTQIGGLYDLATFADYATGHLFFLVILISIFIILIFNLREQGIDKAVAAGSFACLLLSLFLLQLKMVQIVVPVIFAMMLAATLMFLRYKERRV